MHVPLSFVCAVTVLYVRPGKDVATNVEVYWPDGHSVARPLEPSDVNTVLEIHYPREEEEVTPTVEIEVQLHSNPQLPTSKMLLCFVE